MAPKKPAAVERLCVPVTQVLLARNWNLAISCCPFTASRVANSVAVSTPLRRGLSVVVVMDPPLVCLARSAQASAEGR